MAIDQSCLQRIESRARADYRAPGRCYHDERHLDSCLARLRQAEGIGRRERTLLEWAILWHDAVYDPGRPDNEERSAGRAERELRECGVDQRDAAEVARLIRLTKAHRVEPGDTAGALLVSIDLAILGSEPERYRHYVAAVRAEYGAVTEEEWRTGRAAVLRSLLAAEPIYPDPRLRAELEQQARRNLADELRRL